MIDQSSVLVMDNGFYDFSSCYEEWGDYIESTCANSTA